jgi:hypothetical protein
MAVTPHEARALALSLPEAVEQEHHGRPSFRVGGRIFATLWTEERMNVVLDEDGILTALDTAPEVCEPIRWGSASRRSESPSPGLTATSCASG